MLAVHTVRVMSRDGRVPTYGAGQGIALARFGGGEIAVDDIFRA